MTEIPAGTIVRLGEPRTSVEVGATRRYDQTGFSPRLFADGYTYFAYAVKGGTLKRWTLTRFPDGLLVVPPGRGVRARDRGLADRPRGRPAPPPRPPRVTPLPGALPRAALRKVSPPAHAQRPDDDRGDPGGGARRRHRVVSQPGCLTSGAM